MKITAIIMASGQSCRMHGEDKLLLKIDQKEIFRYVLDSVKELPFYERFVVARKREILDYTKEICGIENMQYQKGQSESIRLGVQAIRPCDGIMFFVADQPFLTKETILRLMNSFDKKHIIVPYYGEKRGNPVIFPYALKDDFLRLQADEKGAVVIRKYPELILPISVEREKEGLDIDTKEIYVKVIK